MSQGAISADPNRDNGRQPIRVLVCDDHVVFAESLALVLERAGFEVVAINHSMDEALQSLQAFVVDVCVLDLMYAESTSRERLPSSSSHTLSRLGDMRRANPGAQFILLSGHLSRSTIASARAVGVRGFAHKGCSVGEIVSTVVRVHDGEEVADAVGASAATVGALEQEGEIQRAAQFLTRREREVLGYLVIGADTKTMTKAMGVSWTTARSHIQSVLTKLGAHSRLEAATAAVRFGVVNGETGQWML